MQMPACDRGSLSVPACSGQSSQQIENRGRRGASAYPPSEDRLCTSRRKRRRKALKITQRDMVKRRS